MKLMMYVESEEHELFADVADDLMGSDLEDVEVHGLGEGPALSDEHDISFLDGEGRGDVGRDIAMPLLVTVVFGDVVEVVSSDDHCPLHLGGDDDALEDLTPNGDLAGEGALLIDIVGLDSFLGGLEAESYILVVSHS